jgi:hypothetical protein
VRDEPSVEALERLAISLRGIFSCRVHWQEGEAVPSFVRLVCDRDRRTAAAQDVATAWFAAFGLRVPRDSFAVTAVRSPADVRPASRRFQFCELGYGRAGNANEARVALYLGGETFIGSAVVEDEDDRLRLAALATLAAVSQAVPELPPFVLEEVQESAVGGRPCVLAVVATSERGRGVPYLGAAFVRRDALEAAVRAVLDAVNRQLARFI